MPPNLATIKNSLNSAPTSQARQPLFPLEELALRCTKNAIIVSQYLAAHDQPQPSHESHGPRSTLPKAAPRNIQQARHGLMSSALELFQLAAGPSEFVPNLAPGFQYVACLSWLLHFDIFHLVPASGTISYEDLAAAASKRASSGIAVPVARLRSIVRMVMTSALFREPEPNQVGHSATSALLAQDADVHSWASYLSKRSAPTALAMTTAHDRFTPASTVRNETAYNIAFGTELPFFDHLALDAANAAEFAGYMRNVTTSEAMDVKHLVNGYHWAGLGRGPVVDVGGSTGNAAIALARGFPELTVIVQDLPVNAEAGRQAAEATLPAHVLSRIVFQGHDFTQPQPVADGAVYLLRMILHDWPDDTAVTILKNLVPVLAKGAARLLIMDTVLPTPGQVPCSVERVVRVRDMTMMQVFNGHERDLDQWRALLVAADKRLRLRQVITPFGSAMSLLEVDMAGALQEESAEEDVWEISG
ncbi:sterigmatocystin 8-O-methyltransferase [Xylaria bambusicola]|uniref:sterigmatocystin 8-O-methyltransferase n=1 Tax=Xylaria bambusicola TaxID=326684 RepID=UPI002007D60D|nr:sterigmatocystin 8-O-methyltransferase [Xylaria bambusicola]KAI0517276.1 sterigmatocystin 8-O-methyltransferase [Xylaria bambusicola]